MIPLLKRLGFIDETNVPTATYRDYRDEKKSTVIMAQRVRIAYKDLFEAYEYANKLKKEDVISKLNTVLGTPADDKMTPVVAATFIALCNLANFESKEIEETEEEAKDAEEPPLQGKIVPKLGISYTINLNLPATTDIEVFNAIFKALKENLMK